MGIGNGALPLVPYRDRSRGECAVGGGSLLSMQEAGAGAWAGDMSPPGHAVVDTLERKS